MCQVHYTQDRCRRCRRWVVGTRRPDGARRCREVRVFDIGSCGSLVYRDDYYDRTSVRRIILCGPCRQGEWEEEVQRQAEREELWGSGRE